MATCQHCGAFVAFPFKCKYCGLELCPNCRLPPDHDCAGIGTWRGTSAPHSLAKMDRLHHPELWGNTPTGTQTPYDERTDPRFYPPDEDKILSSFRSPSKPERVSDRLLLQRVYREVAYGTRRFWRYIKKHWFWILGILAGGYVLLVNPALVL